MGAREFRYFAGAASIFVVLVALLGCTDEGADNNIEQPENVSIEAQLTKEELLTKRVMDRMDALIEMDWEKAYAYLSPSRRKITPYNVFANRMSVSAILRKRAAIKNIHCDIDACDVSIELVHVYVGGVIDAMQGHENTSVIHEKWVYGGGEWWYVPE